LNYVIIEVLCKEWPDVQHIPQKNVQDRS